MAAAARPHTKLGQRDFRKIYSTFGGEIASMEQPTCCATTGSSWSKRIVRRRFEALRSRHV
jgi:hypothetical protein